MKPLILPFLIIFLSCETKENHEIFNLKNSTWYLQSISIENIPNYKYPENLIKCQYYTFDSSGVFFRNSIYGKSQGNWQLNDSLLILYVKEDTMSIKIQKKTDNKMLWSTKIDTLNYVFYLSNIKNCDEN